MNKVLNFVFKNGLYMLGVCIILLALKIYMQSKEIDEQTFTIQTLTDSTKISKNKMGQYVAENNILHINNVKQLESLSTKDVVIRRLSERIVEYEKGINNKFNSGIAINTETYDTGSTATIVHISDTISSKPIFPIYSTTWDERWSKGSIKATKDSIFRDIVNYNEFDIISGFKRKNIFNPWVNYVQVTNLNPNTITREVKSISKELPKTSPFSVGFGIGYSINPFQPEQKGVMLNAGIYYRLFNLPKK